MTSFTRGAVAAILIASAQQLVAQAPVNYQDVVNAAYEKYKNLHEGNHASLF